jgi:inorganic triphosphatase YgiF
MRAHAAPANPASTELELKLQLPPARLPAVRRALAGATLERIELHAIYYDTPERDLARHGAALRLRRSRPLDARGRPQGRGRWVQTLKTAASGAAMLERGEHEVELPATVALPQPDFARHAGWPAARELLQTLGTDVLGRLQARYEVRVRRSLRRVQRGGARIEIALDEGEILAGGTRLPLAEVEFELLDGAPAPLYALARQWAERHGLWLDVRSKAERGDLLAEGRQAAPPATAARVRLGDAPQAQAPGALLRRMLANALAQLLANQAVLAAGCAEHEHLHQLRVAIRRLRSLLRLYGDWSAQVDASWEPGLREAFGRTGGARDRDAVAADVLPQLAPALAAAGLPPLELPAPASDEDDAAVQLCRDGRFSALLIELLAFAGQPEPPPVADAEPAAALPPARRARRVLRRLLRRLRDDAAAFTEVDIDTRHRTRKRLKRLRYGLEFAADLFDTKDVKRLLAELRRAQDALGHYNDLLVAEPLLGRCLAAATGPGEAASAAFALGWLAAQLPVRLEQAAASLVEFTDTARLPPAVRADKVKKP